MAKIHLLQQEVAELIAAGEVVERPASIVKELVENAIDAGADQITIEIKGGGVRYIRITDNGCGIAREDVKNAFLRHATSKVLTAEDLNGILTFGFRGEALASVGRHVPGGDFDPHRRGDLRHPLWSSRAGWRRIYWTPAARWGPRWWSGTSFTTPPPG